MSSKKTKLSVQDMILEAIRGQQHHAKANGISRAMIVKYLQSEYQYDKSTIIQKTLKKSVEKKILIQNGQSFRVVGDPEVELPAQPEVIMNDLREGRQGGGEAESEAVKDGDRVMVQYVGKLADGTIFDQASSFTFTLGNGEVIKGWDLGVKGMKVGGIRNLVVPSKLAYGKRGSPPDIPPNSDLTFDITLKRIL